MIDTERIVTPMPIGKRILLAKEEAPEESAGGILLPSDAREPPLEARVLAVGDKVGTITKGEMVIFPAHAGTKFTIGDTDVIVVDEEDIMLVLREVKNGTDD